MAKKNPNAGTGSGVTYTPDPTVNGPWTHTRPDIPLFKPGAIGTPTNGNPATPAPGSTPALGGSPAGGVTARRAGGLGGMGGMGMANPKIPVGGGPSPYGVANPKMGVSQSPSPAGMANPRVPVPMRGSGMALGGAGRGVTPTPQIEDPLLPPVTSEPLPPAPPPATAPSAPTGGMPVSASPLRMSQPPAVQNPNQNPMGGGYRTKMANALARPMR